MTKHKCNEKSTCNRNRNVVPQGRAARFFDLCEYSTQSPLSKCLSNTHCTSGDESSCKIRPRRGEHARKAKTAWYLNVSQDYTLQVRVKTVKSYTNWRPGSLYETRHFTEDPTA